MSEPERAIVSSKDESTDVQLDISKYEGHGQEDMNLIADAPLLLAEVERLRAEVKSLRFYYDEAERRCDLLGDLLEEQEPDGLAVFRRLRNKIRLLDIVEDRDGALDKTLLNSGMLTEKELKGAYSDSELVGVEFLN